jgi:hypothetical protein
VCSEKKTFLLDKLLNEHEDSVKFVMKEQHVTLPMSSIPCTTLLLEKFTELSIEKNILMSSLNHKALNYILKLPTDVSVKIFNDVLVPIKTIDRNFVDYNGSLEKSRAYGRVAEISDMQVKFEQDKIKAKF